ncbi:hypothetical protein [Chelativorans sp. YIM 93263]|uniref:hypothetical protein n=1 Tax=Chelativorans sp. YIM 93263 TaxID=2906648 RepID=UPI00237A088C|nr:hypothetical protein [Chelativorans sp. YIM 93263]
MRLFPALIANMGMRRRFWQELKKCACNCLNWKNGERTPKMPQRQGTTRVLLSVTNGSPVSNSSFSLRRENGAIERFFRKAAMAL